MVERAWVVIPVVGLGTTLPAWYCSETCPAAQWFKIWCPTEGTNLCLLRTACVFMDPPSIDHRPDLKRKLLSTECGHGSIQDGPLSSLEAKAMAFQSLPSDLSGPVRAEWKEYYKQCTAHAMQAVDFLLAALLYYLPFCPQGDDHCIRLWSDLAHWLSLCLSFCIYILYITKCFSAALPLLMAMDQIKEL